MIYAIITLYNPTEEQIDNINAIMKQVDQVIICDNSSTDNSSKIPKGCIYSSCKKNLGLSAAFNRVLTGDGVKWLPDDIIVFFDQDSKIKNGHIQGLLSALIRCEKSGKSIGCIGPIFYNSSNDTTEIPHDKKRVAKGIYEVKSLITSSMMCRYESLKRIGFWNDEIFLDMSDWDLCWRFMAKGLKCYMTSDISLLHSVGNGEKKMGPIRMRVGAPIREYYQIRDCLYLFKKKYTPLKFKIRFLALISIRSLIHVTLFEDRHIRKKYIKRGFVDYKKGIHGEYKNAK